MSFTVLDACLEATNDIWDDRGAYIRASLEALRIDPELAYDEYLAKVTS